MKLCCDTDVLVCGVWNRLVPFYLKKAEINSCFGEHFVTYIPSALRLVEAGHGCVESVAEDY